MLLGLLALAGCGPDGDGAGGGVLVPPADAVSVGVVTFDDIGYSVEGRGAINERPVAHVGFELLAGNSVVGRGVTDASGAFSAPTTAYRCLPVAPLASRSRHEAPSHARRFARSPTDCCG